jgi:hypothetical protein
MAISTSEAHAPARSLPQPAAASHEHVARAVGVVGLLGMALVHLLDVTGKFSETPYLGWMYVGLMVAAVALAVVLVFSGDRRAWLATGALSAAVLLGFVLSRTSGLPGATDDIGNWSEPLGLASLFIESGLLGLSAGALLWLPAHAERDPRDAFPRRAASTRDRQPAR